MSAYWIGWIAALFGIVPLAWLIVLRLRGRRIGAEWWWLAAAFAVSFAADAIAFFLAPASRWLVSAAYPLSQAAIMGLVFLVRRDAERLITVLLVVGVAAVLWLAVTGPDVFFRTVAWGAVVGIVLDRYALGKLRTALLLYFGLGLLAWWGYVLRPGWTSWGIYQSVRAIGIALFCAACLRPVALRLRRTEG